MKYEHLPMIFLALILVYGIYRVLIFPSIYERYEAVRRMMTENEVANTMLRRAGLGISSKQYFLIVYSVGGITVLLFAALAAKKANVGLFFLGCVLAGGFVWAMRPVEKLYGKFISPFAAVVRALTESRQAKFDNELYSNCIVLKNLSIVQQERPLSADYMFEQLARSSKELRSIYVNMISMYRTGQADKAFLYFGNAVGTSNGKTFAGLLSKLDKINPVELKEQVEVMQEAMSEKRQTQGYRNAQRNGVITMAISTAAVMVVMIDFLVVVVLQDVMTMMVF